MTGVFTISLDTELAWGSFDSGGIERYGPAYRETPAVVDGLCELFDRHDVAATWAVVAHLFADCDGHDRSEGSRREWLDRAPCQRGVDRRLWYAPELFETVRNCPTDQEVGLHGYSHLIFDEHSRAAAEAELAAAVEAADTVGLDPASFVYPRNAVAHRDLLADYGIGVYRGVDARWYERRLPATGRKPLRYLDEATRLTPPAVTPIERDGVVSVPGSQVFRPDRGPWAYTPDGSQAARARKGLDRAVETGGVFHLWFHPFNLAGEREHHLSLLEGVLEHAGGLRDAEKLEIMTLTDVAGAYREGRWHDTTRVSAT